MENNKKILTPQLATELYGMHDGFYRKLINTNKLKAWGQRPYYFKREDLERVLDELKEPNIGEVNWKQ